MTTRNFRVNNGLEVGDIVISASSNTIVGLATAAPSADGDVANKKYVDDQDAAIATDTLTLSNKTLTAPKFVDGGLIADANGNELLIFQTTASAVNQLDITNNATGSDPIISATGGDTNVGIAITAKGTGDIALNAGADVNIPVNIGLRFGDGGEHIETNNTDFTITSGGELLLTAASDVVIPVSVGLHFGDGAEKIESDNTDLTVNSGVDINLTATADVNIPSAVGLTFGDDGEKIEGNGTDLTINSGAKINLTATSDVHIPNAVGLVFGDGGEHIETNNTDFTITSGGELLLTAASDVVIPVSVGLHFGDGAEKIESDGTDLTINSGRNIELTCAAAGDIIVPANIGLTFGSGEKIEGDNTDLTINSGGAINLTATTDVVVPANVGITFGSGEKIEGDNTDLTVTSGAKINLTAVSDVHIPNDVGIVFGGASEKIEGDGTDLTISGAKINLAATTDVHLANDIGIVFGDAGEKIEGNGSNLTISSSGDCTITATGQTVVTNNLVVSGNLTVDGTNTVINTTTLSIEDNLIEVNRTVSAASGMPTYSGMVVNRGVNSTDTEEDLFWVWDESFADDGTTIHGNAGGAFTALRASRGIDNASPITATETTLVDIRANVIHALATSAQYADVAERFEADAPMTAGAVVMVGGDAEITETTSDLSDQVFGVISDQPAYAMNAAAGNSESHPFVAMTGRTPVRVTGAVTKGQRLVSSSTKGCARAAATGESYSPFHVIGRALESSTDAGIKLVNCAVRTNN
jgi:hypothetical protein